MADNENAAEKRLSIAKIYLKDSSFESPQSPAIFQRGDWQPQTNLNLRSSHHVVGGDHHEIILTITIEAKEEDKTCFLIELQQAGLFEVAGYEGDELEAIVGSFCPNILFPYARESIASLVQKGGFPEFILQPINFDALYMQSKQQQMTAAVENTETH
ncbi:MAG: protein-export chaperone SecB [Woeseiaceae bacterium]